MFSPPIRRPSSDVTPAPQRRIEIGPVNDPLESEADRLADGALSGDIMADFSSVPIAVRRQPHSASRFTGSGHPLDGPLRRDMEMRFGHDFAGVRVHTGPSAGRSAEALDAEAYTVGSDVVFGDGRFAPATQGGRRLLAHELAHVVQQGRDADPVLRRQEKDGKKKKGKEKPAAKKPPSINGEVAQGDPLTEAELAKVQAAGASVPAHFRRYVVYQDVIKVGGSLAWRFNNPGNLRSSSLQLTKLRGGTGSFAVFADMATGRQAQKSLYINTYGKMSVRDAIEKLTPRSENDTSAYLKDLAKGGVDLDKTVASQIDVLMREVQKNEGLIQGVSLARDPKAQTPTAPGAWRGVPYPLPEPDPGGDVWPGAPWRFPEDQ